MPRGRAVLCSHCWAVCRQHSYPQLPLQTNEGPEVTLISSGCFSLAVLVGFSVLIAGWLVCQSTPEVSHEEGLFPAARVGSVVVAASCVASEFETGC